MPGRVAVLIEFSTALCRSGRKADLQISRSHRTIVQRCRRSAPKRNERGSDSRMSVEDMPRRRRGRTDSRPTVTLRDVAELAQVSQITVSRILRDKGPIAEDTRARVLAAVHDTGYVPN